MSSILKRISSMSKINNKIINNKSKITFNLEESESVLNNKFGSPQMKNKPYEQIENKYFESSSELEDNDL